MKKLFESMDEPAQQFYMRVFNTVLLNAAAVQRGYFDTLLCDTEDPSIMLRWQEAVPRIIEQFQADNIKRLKDGET